jgi:hypothetical protein
LSILNDVRIIRKNKAVNLVNWFMLVGLKWFITHIHTQLVAYILRK